MVEFTEANLSLKTPFKTTGKGVRKNSSSMNKEEGCGPTRSLVQSRKIYTRSGVEQAMKNWEGKIFLQLPHTIPVVPPPPLIGGTAGTCHFLPSSYGHAYCDHNESESYYYYYLHSCKKYKNWKTTIQTITKYRKRIKCKKEKRKNQVQKNYSHSTTVLLIRGHSDRLCLKQHH